MPVASEAVASARAMPTRRRRPRWGGGAAGASIAARVASMRAWAISMRSTRARMSAGSAAPRRTSSKMRSIRRRPGSGSARAGAAERLGGAVGGAGGGGQGELEAGLERRVELAGEAVEPGADPGLLEVAAGPGGLDGGDEASLAADLDVQGGARIAAVDDPAGDAVGAEDVDDAVEARAGRRRRRGAARGRACQLARSRAGGVRAAARALPSPSSAAPIHRGSKGLDPARGGEGLDGVEGGVDRVHRRLEQVVDRVAPPLHREEALDRRFGEAQAEDAAGGADDDGVGGHVLEDGGAGADDRAGADGDAGLDEGALADPGVGADLGDRAGAGEGALAGLDRGDAVLGEEGVPAVDLGKIGGARGGEPVGRVLVRADDDAAREAAVAAEAGVVDGAAREVAEGADLEEGAGRDRGNDRGRGLEAAAGGEAAGVAEAGKAEAGPVEGGEAVAGESEARRGHAVLPQAPGRSGSELWLQEVAVAFTAGRGAAKGGIEPPSTAGIRRPRAWA